MGHLKLQCAERQEQSAHHAPRHETGAERTPRTEVGHACAPRSQDAVVHLEQQLLLGTRQRDNALQIALALGADRFDMGLLARTFMRWLRGALVCIRPPLRTYAPSSCLHCQRGSSHEAAHAPR